MKNNQKSDIQSPPKRISEQDKARAERRKRIEDFELAKEMGIDINELMVGAK